MSEPKRPVQKNQDTPQTTPRVVAVVLLVGGLATFGFGIIQFVGGFANPMAMSPMTILIMAAGGFATIFGLAASNVGWSREGGRFIAGETAPILKDSLEYLARPGEPLAPSISSANSLFCAGCGARNVEDANFCSACGKAISRVQTT